MENEWGIPDWKNEKAYEKYDTFTGEELRWQYLRRHYVYRQAWLDQNNPNIEQDFGRDFGLEVLHNPRQHEAPYFLSRDAVIVPYGADIKCGEAKNIFRHITRAALTGCVLVIWDPSLSATNNLKNIKKAYDQISNEEGFKQANTRLRPDRISVLLRLLDAKGAEKTLNRDIADAFTGKEIWDPKKVDREFQKAREEAARRTGVPWPKGRQTVPRLVEINPPVKPRS